MSVLFFIFLRFNEAYILSGKSFSLILNSYRQNLKSCMSVDLRLNLKKR